MTGFEETREKIRQTIKNEDLQFLAISMADAIEYMSNCYSNSQKKGIKDFDKAGIDKWIRLKW